MGIGSILTLLLIGLVVGLLARAVLPGRQAMPWWLTMLIGAGSLLVAGALLSTSLVVEILVGTLIAAAVIALTTGGVRGRARV